MYNFTGNPNAIDTSKSVENSFRLAHQMEQQAAESTRQMERKRARIARETTYSDTTTFKRDSYEQSKLAHKERNESYDDFKYWEKKLEDAKQSLENAKQQIAQIQSKGSLKPQDHKAAALLVKDLADRIKIYNDYYAKYLDSYEKMRKSEIKASQAGNFVQNQIDSEVRALHDKAKVQDLILQGKYQQARLLKVQNDYLAKGLILVSEHRDIIEAENNLRLKEQRQKQYDSMFNTYTNALQNAGFTRKAMQMQRFDQVERQQGFALTKKQKQRIRTAIDYQLKLKDFNLNNIASRGTQTNELAARGGFSSSVLRDNVFQVNKQILQQTRQYYSILINMQNMLRNVGRIK